MRADAIKTEAINRVAKEASLRTATKNQSIVSFAERHGWDVKEDSDDYTISAWLDKNDQRAWLTLFRGPNPSIATAVLNGVQLPQTFGFPARERVEAYLVGVACTCSPDPTLYHYEQIANPDCRIHGA